MKCPSEMPQNLPYFIHTKIQIKLLFPFFISCNFIFFPNDCPGLCQHRPGNSLRKKIKLYEMKNKKYYVGFLMIKNGKF